MDGKDHYDEISPSLTSDERLLLSSLDPKYKLFPELVSEHDARNSAAANYAAIRKGAVELEGYNEVAKDVPPMPVSGGFPLAALAPIAAAALPIVAPLVKDAAVGLFGLLRKKARGRGVFVPNARGGSVGTEIDAFIDRNQPRFKSMEQNLLTLKGADFWKNLSNMAKSEVARILPQMADIVPQRAARLASAAINRYIPRGFERYLANEPVRTSTSGVAVGSGIMQNKIGELVKPVARWAVGKILKHSDNAAKLHEAINRVSDYLDTADTKNRRHVKIDGGLGLTSAVRARTKKVLSKILPGIARISKAQIPRVIDAALAKFGVEGNLATDLMKETLPEFIPDGNDIGYLMGDDEDEEEDIEVKPKRRVIRKKPTFNDEAAAAAPSNGFSLGYGKKKGAQGRGPAKFTVKLL